MIFTELVVGMLFNFKVREKTTQLSYVQNLNVSFLPMTESQSNFGSELIPLQIWGSRKCLKWLWSYSMVWNCLRIKIVHMFITIITVKQTIQCVSLRQLCLKKKPLKTKNNTWCHPLLSDMMSETAFGQILRLGLFLSGLNICCVQTEWDHWE